MSLVAVKGCLEQVEQLSTQRGPLLEQCEKGGPGYYFI